MEPFVAGDTLVMDELAREALAEWDVAARLELAGDVPPLQWPAVTWATMQFYRACQFLLSRDASAETVMKTLAQPCPLPAAPDVVFSVDLIFRFLPELAQRANQLAPGDPLVIELQKWAHAWPLSSVGIALDPAARGPALEPLLEAPPLWRLYLDRIAARHATDRWREPRVAAALRADLGAYPELAPALASALDRPPPPATPLLSA